MSSTIDQATADRLFKKLETAFATYPKTDTFYVTSDVQLFSSFNLATFHAGKQKVDKSVATVTRASFAAAQASGVAGISSSGSTAASTTTAATFSTATPIPTGDPSLAHPEQTTVLTPAALAAQAQINNAATSTIASAIAEGAADAAKSKK
jgi:hypothetical protein